jgi:hypothetical protein
LIALPLFEIANVLARFDHVSNFIDYPRSSGGCRGV